MQQDREVVIERNEQYWGERPRVARVRFTVVPDTTTRALELRKGSADIALNSLTADMVLALAPRSQAGGPGRPPAPSRLSGVESARSHPQRCARAAGAGLRHRPPPADPLPVARRGAPRRQHPSAQSLGLRPPTCRTYDYNPQRARELLDQAGYRASNGVRFHLTMKTSTEETTRLLAAVLQQQLRAVGIALDHPHLRVRHLLCRRAEGRLPALFAALDRRQRGSRHLSSTSSTLSFTPPAGANRSYYSNPRSTG